ncbi:hypothetical protein PS898_01167 [Pseudomonas fluorescens]|nr:hypothetical protein PS898_01167 [Pseudomonas fluorescens]
MTGRHREQAHSYSLGWMHSTRDWPAHTKSNSKIKRSQPSAAPTGSPHYKQNSKQHHRGAAAPLNRMSVSSTAALDLQGPVGRLRGGIHPGGRRAAPFDEVEHIERRCSAANRKRCARMDPGAKEPRAPASGPNVGAKPFGLPFRRLEKVTRRKGGTLCRHHKKNGYSPQRPQHGRPKGRQVKSVKAENAQPSPATHSPTAPAQYSKPHSHASQSTTDPHSREYSSHCD